MIPGSSRRARLTRWSELAIYPFIFAAILVAAVIVLRVAEWVAYADCPQIGTTLKGEPVFRCGGAK